MRLSHIYFVIAVGIATLAFFALSPKKSGYMLYASFKDIGELKRGAPIRLSGIAVGRVEGMRLEPDYSVVMTMGIYDTFRFPDDSAVAIYSDGLMGGKYVAILPGGSSDYMAPGGYFEYSQDAIDITRMIGIGIDKFMK